MNYNSDSSGKKQPQNKKAELQDLTKKPSTLAPIIDNIPAELRARPWVCWEWRKRRNKKSNQVEWSKVPIRCMLGFPKASATDPATWSTFDEAVAFYRQHSSVRLDGLGVILGGGITGIDLDDDCPDRNKLVTMFGSYAELSPTGGYGFKVFTMGRVPGIRHRGHGCEIYDDGRYFAVTGHHVVGTPAAVTACQPAIDRFYADKINRPEVKPSTPAKRAPAEHHAADPASVEDQLIIDVATAENEKFKPLFAGDFEEWFTSQSEADASLVSILYYYSGDNSDGGQVDRIFRRSALMRDKWERGDYRNSTLSGAVATSHYDWHAYRQRVRREHELDALATLSVASCNPTGVATFKDTGLLTWDELKAIAAKQQDVWIIRDVVEPGTSTVFSGLPFSGKTTVLAWLMACVACEKSFFGYEIKQRCPILFLNCDRLRERHIVKRMKAAVPDPLDECKLSEVFFTLDLPRIPVTVTPSFMVDLIGMVKDRVASVGSDTGIIVCDPLRAAFLQELEAGAENDGTTMTQVLNPIRQMCRETNWAAITPHHNSKGRNDYAGAASIAGCSDAMWNIKREEMSVISELFIQTRDDPLPGIRIKKTDDGLSTIDRAKADAEKQEQEEKELAALIAKFPALATDAWTKQDAVNNGVAHSVSDINRFLTRAERPGKSPRLESIGTGVRGDPLRYFRV